MPGERRLAAQLSCGCTRHYPAGVRARRHELVLCPRHGQAVTVAVASAACAATIERRMQIRTTRRSRMTGTLFDLDEPAPIANTPRCRMCARTARWLTTRQQYAPYCAGQSCSNRDRLCQQCGAAFIVKVDGAGTKYCSTECKVTGYNPQRATAERSHCAWCGQAGSGGSRDRWPYICPTCLDPIKHVLARLKDHHVPHERARRLLDNPGCEICQRNLLEKIRRPGGGKPAALLVVDHDHSCCPSGEHSCGRCVRGLICKQCNTAAGMLSDDASNARRLADYLARFSP